MRFPELVIENFLAITQAKVSLADRGLVVIQGENHADTSASSNGAGKSSIPDALCWCWFGVTARGVTGDEVINDDAKKNCRVVSVVEDGHMTYTATRHRKHKTGKNTFTIEAFDGFKKVDLTKGTEKLTQEVANQIIGCSHEVFAGSIYAGQEVMPDLPGMTDKPLKMLIEEAADITVLEGAYRRALKEQQAAALEHDSLATVIKANEDKLTWLNGQIASQRALSGAWEANKVARIDALKTQAAAVVPELRRLQGVIAAIDIDKIDTEIAGIDAQIAAVGAENTKLAGLEGRVGVAEHELDITHRLEADARAKVTRLNGELLGINHKVGCPCGECGRLLTPAELADVTAATTRALNQAEGELRGYELERETRESELERAVEARDAFRLMMTDISAASARRAALTAEHASYQALVNEQTLVTAKARGIRDQVATVGAETNPNDAQIAKLEADKTALETMLTGLRAKLKKQAETVELEAEVVKVFSPAGVRAHILDEVTPFLNAQTAKYLATLSDGNIEANWSTLTANAKGELREKFSIEVTNSTGGKVFKGLSGGEKRKVRLSTSLALQDLVATRASKPIDLFIGDEIDDALDPAGLERLTMILEEKARERGTVFVISHNELRDHIKQVMLVEKMPDKTTRVTEMTA